ncbi:hypothetical protein F0250_20625 [Vibrio cyclitrophicus]|nr:hypothetical protein [Vibrio cyclitrophicus]
MTKTGHQLIGELYNLTYLRLSDFHYFVTRFCPEPSFVLILLLVWLSSLDNGSLTCTMLDRIF